MLDKKQCLMNNNDNTWTYKVIYNNHTNAETTTMSRTIAATTIREKQSGLVRLWPTNCSARASRERNQADYRD